MNDQAKTNVKRVWPPPLRRWVIVFAFLMAGPWVARAQESTSADKPPTTPSESAPQQPTGDKTPPTAAPTGGRIQYVGPDTYILLDSAGKPQPMPGMTYEDFLAAWKKLNQPKSAASQPGFTIERINFEGQSHGQRAELQFTATIRLLADGSADVPLGLVGAILQGEPLINHGAKPAGSKSEAGSAEPAPLQHDDNEHLSYDPDRGGFIVRLAGRASERRTLTCNLIVPLIHDGAEISLPINCPRAVSSQLTLKIDSATTEVRTNVGTVLSQETSKGETNVKVVGPAGLFRLTWQTASNDSPAITSVLNALGAIRVTVDGRGVRSDARLTVRSYGGAFDQFRVRLPLGTQLIQARPDASARQDAKYRIRVEPDSARTASDKGPNRQVVVVELPEKQQGPVVIDLATEQSGNVEDSGQEIDLAGFEVLGAVRQFGDIALSIADDWQARWTIGSYVRQVDPNELDQSLQTSNPAAAFQYDRQPWSLKLRVTPRQLRVHVTPKYELQCLPEETRLTIRLAYQVFGARAFEFRVELNGWEMTGDPVESGGLVDQDRIVVIPDNTLLLPLAQASSRRAEISFTLRRPIARDASRLELPLPAPAADSVGTGELIVRAAPDIDLLPDLSTSTGLTAAPAPQAPVATGNENGTELRFRTLLPAAIFVADRANRPGEVSTQTTTQIDLAQDVAQIDQRIDYLVQYEPVTELVFEVPSDLSPDLEKLELFLLPASSGSDTRPDEQGTPLHISPIDDDFAAATLMDSRQLRVMLPQPRIGRFAARIRYRLPQPSVGATDTDWLIPLPHPADGRLTSSRATVRAPRSLTVGLDTSIDDATWTSVASQADSNTQNTTYGFVADAPELYLPLIVRAGRPDLSSPTIIDRVWLQTWFSNGVEQDRSTFRFRTTGNQTTVELPPDTLSAEIEVLVDRQPAEVLSRAPGRIVVRLPQPTDAATAGMNAVAATHTLELRSRQPYLHNLLTRHRLTPPQLEGSTALSQVYWHIVLPGDEHVVDSPDQLTSASEWQWLGSFFGRRPLKSQPDLEAWTNASEQMAPAADQNQYLFTGLLPVASIELATAPRWTIVLGASAAVLLLAIAWLYVPVARQSWVVAVAVCAIAASAIAYPAAALLLAQASVVGVLLGAVAIVLSRFVARPRLTPIAPTAAASSQRMVTPRMDSILMPPVIAAASTAPTASLRLSDSER